MTSVETTEVLVTGRLWLSADGACLIGPSIVQMINNAQQEVIIVAYRLTVAVPEFNRALESALARGCIIRIVIDRSGAPVTSEESHFNRLISQFRNLSVWDFNDNRSHETNLALHAKMIIIDRSNAIVGSANFSRNGMIDNHEIAVRVSGKGASSLAIATDQLIENGQREGIVKLRRNQDATNLAP